MLTVTDEGPGIKLAEVERIFEKFYRGGRTEAQVRQAINIVEATRAQTLAVETTVFQAVAQAYLDVVRDQDLLAVNRNNEYVLGQEFESTRIRVEVGELTGTDLAQAQSSLEQATAQRVAAEGQLEIGRANYTRAVGHPPGRLTLPRERPALPATREEARSLAARANPNVISAGFTELAARVRECLRGLPDFGHGRGTIGGRSAAVGSRENLLEDAHAIIEILERRLCAPHQLACELA